MNFELKGVHYNPSDKTKEFFMEKMAHLDRLKENIQNIEFIVTKTTHGYELAANLHLKWGTYVRMEESGIELYPTVDILMDKLHQKITKEKDKVSSH